MYYCRSISRERVQVVSNKSRGPHDILRNLISGVIYCSKRWFMILAFLVCIDIYSLRIYTHSCRGNASVIVQYYLKRLIQSLQFRHKLPIWMTHSYDEYDNPLSFSLFVVHAQQSFHDSRLLKSVLGKRIRTFFTKICKIKSSTYFAKIFCFKNCRQILKCVLAFCVCRWFSCPRLMDTVVVAAAATLPAYSL